MHAAFRGTGIDVVPNMNDWDVNNVTIMTRMFQNTLYFNTYIGDWDVSNVANMSYMFENTVEYNQPLDNWNTESLIDMQAMFSFSQSFNQPVGHFNTNKVSQVRNIFASAKAFNQPLNEWELPVAIDFSMILHRAKSFDQPLDNWANTVNNAIYGLLAFSFNAMSCENYSKTLVAWSQHTDKSFSFGADSLQYSHDIADLRSSLDEMENWNITGDSEGDCSFILAVDKQNLSEIKVHPNPASERITVSNTAKINRLTLVDLSGKQVFSMNAINNTELSFAVDSYLPGIYMLHISTNSGVVVKKIVIQ